MVKVFTTDKDGKISFTKDEIEKLLNEVWEDGRNAICHYWWSSPTITTTSTPPTIYDPNIKITC